MSAEQEISIRQALKIALLMIMVFFYAVLFVALFAAITRDIIAIQYAEWSSLIFGGAIAIVFFRNKGRVFYIIAAGLWVILYILLEVFYS
ncbi:MAG: hypothetical protein ACRBF0_06990 [Calditrichia bacterium]